MGMEQNILKPRHYHVIRAQWQVHYTRRQPITEPSQTEKELLYGTTASHR